MTEATTSNRAPSVGAGAEGAAGAARGEGGVAAGAVPATTQ